VITVAIGVCTVHRPIMLQKCLESLARQKVPLGVAPIIVVADNEANATNRSAVENFVTTCPLPLRYVHEPRRGISMARNAILEAALELRADWIAFIDDDETAAPDWLAELLAAAERHNADVIQGRVEPVHPEPTPFWVVPSKTRKEGQNKGSAGGGNVLFSSHLICYRGAGLRFDQAFALTGGEDTDFFARAYASGFHIAHSNKPLVFEHWPVERCTYSAQVSRSFNASMNEMRRQRGLSLAGRAAIKAAGSAAMGVFSFIIAAACAPISRARFKAKALQGGKRLASAAGRFAALAGYRSEPYRRTTGY